MGEIETAVVKHGNDETAAKCLSLEMAQQKIYDAAVRAVHRLGEGKAPEPLRFSTPVTLTVQFLIAPKADGAVLVPGARRLTDRRVEFVADDMIAAFYALRLFASLG